MERKMNWLNSIFLIAVVFVAVKQIRTKKNSLKFLSKESIPVALLVVIALSIVMWWMFSDSRVLDTRIYIILAACQAGMALMAAVYTALSLKEG